MRSLRLLAVRKLRLIVAKLLVKPLPDILSDLSERDRERSKLVLVKAGTAIKATLAP